MFEIITLTWVGGHGDEDLFFVGRMFMKKMMIFLVGGFNRIEHIISPPCKGNKIKSLKSCHPTFSSNKGVVDLNRSIYAWICLIKVVGKNLPQIVGLFHGDFHPMGSIPIRKKDHLREIPSGENTSENYHGNPSYPPPPNAIPPRK